MGFLSELLRRPDNERPYLLMPVGFPSPDAQVPAIRRKPLEAIVQWNLGAQGQAIIAPPSAKSSR